MVKSLVAYPAVLRPLHDDKDTYLIKFPDVPSAISEGYGLENSYLMASDALATALYDESKLPKASSTNAIELPTKDSIAVIVTADLEQKAKEFQKKVRKQVTISADLAERAEAENINFSKTLDEALQERLG
ncbi:MAG: type II toxin-antitoxin system CcdA family antitoxin [Lactobacillus sp.]|jgi:post-segregation antitoxin (ccd killing protein)|nr:type II toxin-antitoxin system CcdA family antitoxin [Lactobacillus sp.]